MSSLYKDYCAAINDVYSASSSDSEKQTCQAEAAQYANTRIAIGVALFIVYLLHTIILTLATYDVNKKKNLDKVKYISKRLWLWGMFAALSTGQIQGSVYGAIIAWFSLPIIFILHWVVFTEDQNDKHKDFKSREKYVWFIYYLSLVLWSLGLVCDNFNSNIMNYNLTP